MDAATLTSLLQRVLGLADAACGVREAAAALRAPLAPWRVVVVDPLDMRDEAPAARSERHALWLAASDGHCWTLTDDPSRVAGLFIADRSAR